MSVEPEHPSGARAQGVSEPIDLVAEIKRRKCTTRPGSPSARSTAAVSPERGGARDQESEFALRRSARYSLADGLGLDEPDTPDDVLDALTGGPGATDVLTRDVSTPGGAETGDLSGDELDEDAIRERLHRHHELARPRPVASDVLRGSAQLAPGHVHRRPSRHARASAAGAVRERQTRTRLWRRRLIALLAVAAVGVTGVAGVVLLAGGSRVPRHQQLTVAAGLGAATVGLGQSLFSLMARVHGEIADEAQTAARAARERAQRQARRRRDRAQRRKREQMRKRAAARNGAKQQASRPILSSQSDGRTATSPTASVSTVTVTTPAISSSSGSAESASATAGPTGVGSSSGGCNPKCG